MAYACIQINVKIFLPLLRVLQTVHQLLNLAAQPAQFRALCLDLRIQVKHGMCLLLVDFRLLLVDFRLLHVAFRLQPDIFSLLLAGFFQFGSARIQLLHP